MQRVCCRVFWVCDFLPHPSGFTPALRESIKVVLANRLFAVFPKLRFTSDESEHLFPVTLRVYTLLMELCDHNSAFWGLVLALTSLGSITLDGAGPLLRGSVTGEIDSNLLAVGASAYQELLVLGGGAESLGGLRDHHGKCRTPCLFHGSPCCGHSSAHSVL